MTPETPSPRSPRPARPARVHVAPLWHAYTPAEALAALGSTDAGLDGTETARHLAAHGPNRLLEVKGGGPLRILVRQFRNPLNYVLVASTALAILTGDVADGLVILGVVVLNALIGFVQEVRAGKAIRALSAMVPQEATVRRDGHPQTVPAASLVPGDVVTLQPGDKVPADLRLLETRSLTVEEAALPRRCRPALTTRAARACSGESRRARRGHAALDRALVGGGGHCRRVSTPHAAAARRLSLRAPADDPASHTVIASPMPPAPRNQPASRSRRRYSATRLN